MGSLDGKNALVTGGASGIGLATAKLFASSGAAVAIADIDEERLREVAEAEDLHPIYADVSSSEQVSEMFDAADARLGGLDIAYLNAGITVGIQDITAIDDATYERIRGVNIDGVFFGVREAARRLREGGSIIATASIAGINSYPVDPTYALTKHAVVGLVRALAPLLEPRLSIDAICPGVVDTPLIGDARQLFVDSGFPLLSPEDVAEAVMFALDEEGSGRAIVVQPGRDSMVYGFRGVPGPRGAGEGKLPPIFG